MSKIPSHIKKAIRDKGKYNVLVYEADKIIRDWMESIGKDEDDSWRDILIDGTEQSTDDSEHVINRFEKMI